MTWMIAGVIFDPTISLGNILSIISFILGLFLAAQNVYHAMDKRIAHHSKTLEEHADRMEAQDHLRARQDELLLKLVGDVQRLIGQWEERRGRQR